MCRHGEALSDSAAPVSNVMTADSTETEPGRAVSLSTDNNVFLIFTPKQITAAVLPRRIMAVCTAPELREV